MESTQQQPKATVAKHLEGKIALVTGASRGIGAAIALRLAEEGATIAVNYNSSKAGADKVVAKIAELGSKAVAFQGNVSSGEETKKLIAEVGKQYGKIDILVNNAGVHQSVPIEKITEEHIDHMLAVNVKGVALTTKEALKYLPDGGCIINISSVAAETQQQYISIYSGTKAALDTLTRIWAQELGHRQITVNGVAPGPTVSDMFNDSATEEIKQQFINKTALGRNGAAEDIAAVVAFLASNEGRWVTGQTITASGGIIL